MVKAWEAHLYRREPSFRDRIWRQVSDSLNPVRTKGLMIGTVVLLIGTSIGVSYWDKLDIHLNPYASDPIPTGAPTPSTTNSYYLQAMATGTPPPR